MKKFTFASMLAALFALLASFTTLNAQIAYQAQSGVTLFVSQPATKLPLAVLCACHPSAASARLTSLRPELLVHPVDAPSRSATKVAALTRPFWPLLQVSHRLRVFSSSISIRPMLRAIITSLHTLVRLPTQRRAILLPASVRRALS